MFDRKKAIPPSVFIGIPRIYPWEDVNAPIVRVVTAGGMQLGVITIEDALSEADEADMDLIMIVPMADPPVCRVQEYGKFRYEQEKKEKETRRSRKKTEIKEIRLTPGIGRNDLRTKEESARKFLARGDRVRAVLRFRGREVYRMEELSAVLKEFVEDLGDIGTAAEEPKTEGRSITVMLAPGSKM